MTEEATAEPFLRIFKMISIICPANLGQAHQPQGKGLTADDAKPADTLFEWILEGL